MNINRDKSEPIPTVYSHFMLNVIDVYKYNKTNFDKLYMSKKCNRLLVALLMLSFDNIF